MFKKILPIITLVGLFVIWPATISEGIDKCAASLYRDESSNYIVLPFACEANHLPPTPQPPPFPGQAEALNILITSGITLSTNADCDVVHGAHASGVINAIATRNYPRVCFCGCTTTSVCPTGGTSGKTTVNPSLLQGIIKLHDKGGYNFTITSLTTGSHCGGSSHYDGQAVDLVPSPMDATTLKNVRTYLNGIHGHAICEDPATEKDVSDCSTPPVTHIHWTY